MSFPFPLFGWLDAPSHQQVVSGIVTLSGWVVSSDPNACVIDFLLDGRPLWVGLDRVRRDDVLAVHRDFAAHNPMPGFLAYFSSYRYPNGPHEIVCLARQRGLSLEIGRASITIQNTADFSQLVTVAPMLPADVVEILDREQIMLQLQTTGYESTQGLPALVEWMFSPPSEQFLAVRRYAFFLQQMYAVFRAIHKSFPHRNRGREDKKDSEMAGTLPEEMLYLANQLYILESYRVEGVVLECGCFKGYSSCCLSQACAALNRQLFIADSFVGLPPTEDISYYQPGDFAGSLGEVQQHLQAFGKPEAVQYLKGWFSATLPGWSQPIALLWTDADLHSSTLDVLHNVFPSVQPRATMFSHEFNPSMLDENARISHPHYGSASAYKEYLEAHQIEYRTWHVWGNTAAITFPQSVAPQAHQFLPEVIAFLRNQQ